MIDRTLTCRDCGTAFTFTAGEQAFFQERGFSEPQRCPTCRASRKAQRGGGYDGGYSNGGYQGGGYAGGGGGYSAAARQLHPTVCAACGKATEVPFVPRGDKPVYCRECFQERRAPISRFNYSRY
jgi:CxxC-x17-CxxC domain-containing protein